MERVIGIGGLFTMMAIAWLLSTNRKKIPLKPVVGGLLLQVIFALFIFTPLGNIWSSGINLVLSGINFLTSIVGIGPMTFSTEKMFNIIGEILNLSDSGAALVFGDGFREHFFAFKVSSTIIFVSTVSYVLFYFGVLQKIIQYLARCMTWSMGVSGSESLAMAANVFVGQTEAPLLVKPYLKTMTRSELMALMTGGMATIAGGVLAAYASMGIDLGHLISASIMSAPAALLISKIMVPETEQSVTAGFVELKHEIKEVNVFEAAVNGTRDGLFLALNVCAMLIAFTALIALVNYFLGGFGTWNGTPITLQLIFGWIFQPIAWIMGVEWQDCQNVGQLIGIKTTLNEFVAYIDLGKMIEAGSISERSATIATYALCGFANFSSIGIQIGGLASLEESKKQDFAKLGLRAMVGATLAAFMTACMAGIFY